MGSNIGKDKVLCSVVTEAVKEVAKIPGVAQAHAGDAATSSWRRRRASAAAPTRSSRRTPSRRCRSSIRRRSSSRSTSTAWCRAAGSAGRRSCRCRSPTWRSMTQAFPDRAFSGIGGVSDFSQALSLLPAGLPARCRCARRRCSTRRSARMSSSGSTRGSTRSSSAMRPTAGTRVEDFRGIAARPRGAAVADPPAGEADYQGGYEPVEGYAAPGRVDAA